MHNFSVKCEHETDWFSYTGYCQDVTYSNLFVNIESIEVNHVSVILERMRAPVRHISYGIRHTALCRMYGIVAYVRHNNHAGSPVLGIPALPH